MKITLESRYFKHDNLAVDAETDWGATNEWHCLLGQLNIDKAKWDDIDQVEVDVLNFEIQ